MAGHVAPRRNKFRWPRATATFSPRAYVFVLRKKEFSASPSLISLPSSFARNLCVVPPPSLTSTLTIFWKSLPPPHTPFSFACTGWFMRFEADAQSRPLGWRTRSKSPGAFRGENRDVLHHPTGPYSALFPVIYVPAEIPDTPWGMPRTRTHTGAATSKTYDQRGHTDLSVAGNDVVLRRAAWSTGQLTERCSRRSPGVISYEFPAQTWVLASSWLFFKRLVGPDKFDGFLGCCGNVDRRWISWDRACLCFFAWLVFFFFLERYPWYDVKFVSMLRYIDAVARTE